MLSILENVLPRQPRGRVLASRGGIGGHGRSLPVWDVITPELTGLNSSNEVIITTIYWALCVNIITLISNKTPASINPILHMKKRGLEKLKTCPMTQIEGLQSGSHLEVDSRSVWFQVLQPRLNQNETELPCGCPFLRLAPALQRSACLALMLCSDCGNQGGRLPTGLEVPGPGNLLQADQIAEDSCPPAN